MTTGRHDAADADPLVSAREAADLLGTSERTIRRRIASGDLPSIKVGGQRRIPLSALGVSSEHDGVTPVSSRRHDEATRPRVMASVMTPAVTSPPAVDLSPLAAIIERQAEEIGRLSAELATATERLRVLTAGQDAPTTRPEAPGATEPPRPATETLALRWRRWWRGVRAG